jgi:predicted transcriptional regulator
MEAPAGNGGINSGATVHPDSTTSPDHVAVSIVRQDPTIAAEVELEEGTAELEIKSLVWLRQMGNELYAAAYEEWQRKDTLFAKRVDKKRLQSSSLRNEIYQLIGFYSVFQGVLLTAVAQSNLLLCYNLWTALSLSVFASVVTILAVLQKFKAIYSLEKTIKNESISRQDCIVRCRKLLQKRGAFTFRDHAADGADRPYRQWSLRFSIILIVLVLVSFSTLFGLSIERILCHSNGPSSPPTTSS